MAPGFGSKQQELYGRAARPWFTFVIWDIPGEDDKMDLFGSGQKQMPVSFPSPSCLLRYMVVGCRRLATSGPG